MITFCKKHPFPFRLGTYSVHCGITNTHHDIESSIMFVQITIKSNPMPQRDLHCLYPMLNHKWLVMKRLELFGGCFDQVFKCLSNQE